MANTSSVLYQVGQAVSAKIGNSSVAGITSLNGNVGIGTTTPGYTLEVKKDVDDWVSRIYNTGSDINASGLLVRTDATAAHDTHAFAVHANGGYKFSVKSNGKVGIGTTSPNANLSIVSPTIDTDVIPLVLSTADPSVSVNQEVSIGFGQADVTFAKISSYYAGSTGSGGFGLKMYTGGNAGSGVDRTQTNPSLTIDQDGNVGIGTTTPDYPLDIYGTNGSVALRVTDSQTWLRSNHATNATLYVDQLGVGPTALFMNGNVGIGTTTPGKLLHIRDTTAGNTGIIIENTVNAQNLDIDYYGNTGTAQGRIRYQEGSGAFEINPNTATDAPFKILYDGKVGIGTTGPAEPLHVNGNTRVDGNLIFNPTGNTSYLVGSVLSTEFRNNLNNSTLLTIRNDGKVGIGYSAPSSKLHVKGSLAHPFTSGSQVENSIARFGQTSGNGVLDVGFGDPYSWLQSRDSTNYATNYDLAIQPNGGDVAIGTVFPKAKLHVAQDLASVSPVLELQYNNSEGGFYKQLGVVSENNYSSTTQNYYIHVRIRTVYNDEGMGFFKARGYLPYGNILDTNIGMYRYGIPLHRYVPHVIAYNAQGNMNVPASRISGTSIPTNAGLSNVYNTNADPGYLVLVFYWPTNYTGITLEYFGGGGNFGWRMQPDLEIIDRVRSTSSSTAQW